jgi:hypothetical protein
MKNIFVIALMVLTLGFVSCNNNKAEEEAARLKVIEDSLALVHFNDSVAAVEMQKAFEDSIALVVADSLKLVAYNDSIAAASKKTPAKKVAPKPVVKPATLQDVKHDIKQVTPTETQPKGRG